MEHIINTRLIGEEDKKKNGLSDNLMGVFAELPDNIKKPESRWKNTFNTLFSSLAKMTLRFFTSRIKSDEMRQTQSCIHRIFRQTDYVDKIEKDTKLQDIFLLGYCHAIDEMTTGFEKLISDEQDERLKAAISSYKNIKPILYALDENFEMGHKELAEKIGISKSALSNVMTKLQTYELFNSVRVGKKRFYSLAHPNGETALRIVKKEERPTVDGYTEFLLKLLKTLKNIGNNNNAENQAVLKECEEAMNRYTTKPALCKKSVEDLVFRLKSEQIYLIFLKKYEGMVEKSVTVFTRDIQSEVFFDDIILKNLRRKIVYQWFFTATEEIDSEEKAEEFLCEKLSSLNNGEEEFYLKQEDIHCHIILEHEKENLLGNISDAVLYDDKEGFACLEEISQNSVYTSMEREKVELFEAYAKKRQFAG